MNCTIAGGENEDTEIETEGLIFYQMRNKMMSRN